jgi:hypothetical protein
VQKALLYLKLFSHLQTSQRSKETWQLQLLLPYLQNGISQQWQSLPSIIAVFAAEASLTLLDISHAQFTAVSNFFNAFHLRQSAGNSSFIYLHI